MAAEQGVVRQESDPGEPEGTPSMESPGLAEQYDAQTAWRDWDALCRMLADTYELGERDAVDLGCGTGSVTRILAKYVRSVVGVDGNAMLLEHAGRAPQSDGIHFENLDLAEWPQNHNGFDGTDLIWSSFAAAYFPDLRQLLERWYGALRPGGLVIVTEIDGLLEHEPLPKEARRLLDAFCERSLELGLYDFHAGARLESELTGVGFQIESTIERPDAELCFDGPAEPAIVRSWEARLDRMTRLQEFSGGGFSRLRGAFLRALSHPEHESRCRVLTVVARRPE